MRGLPYKFAGSHSPIQSLPLSHTNHCSPTLSPIQITATLPYKSLPRSHTNHCQVSHTIHCHVKVAWNCHTIRHCHPPYKPLPPPIQITATSHTNHCRGGAISITASSRGGWGGGGPPARGEGEGGLLVIRSSVCRHSCSVPYDSLRGSHTNHCQAPRGREVVVAGSGS